MAIGAFLKIGAKFLAKGAKVGAKVGSKVKSGVKKINPKKVFNKKGKDKTDKKTGGALDIIKKNDDKEKGDMVKFDAEQAKERERQRRRNAESNLESKNKKKRNKFGRIKKAGGNILSKIINFLSTILIGWVVDKLPKILKFAENVTEKIKQIYQSIVNFGKTVGNFFKKIKDSIVGVVEKIKEFDFRKIGEKIKEKITGLKDGFTNIIDKIKGGLGLLKKKEKQDPKKLAKQGNIEEPKEDVDINKLKSDTEKLKTDSESELNKFDEIIKNNVSESNINVKIENTKSGKDNKKIKVDKLMTPSASSATKEFNKDATKSDSVTSSIGTINFDGQTFPMGSSGLGGYIPGGGKGGSTYGGNKTMLNSSNINKIDNSQAIGNLSNANKKKTIMIDNPVTTKIQVASQKETALLGSENANKNDSLKERQLINAAYT